MFKTFVFNVLDPICEEGLDLCVHRMTDHSLLKGVYVCVCVCVCVSGHGMIDHSLLSY